MPRIRNKNKFVPADGVALTNGDIVRIIPKPLNTEFVCGGEHKEYFYTTLWFVSSTDPMDFYDGMVCCTPITLNDELERYLGVNSFCTPKWWLDNSEIEVKVCGGD